MCTKLCCTHRVVCASYGRLACLVWLHRVDDSLPFTLLVDFAESPPGLTMRSLTLKILLILIHIVHLPEEQRDE